MDLLLLLPWSTSPYVEKNLSYTIVAFFTPPPFSLPSFFPLPSSRSGYPSKLFLPLLFFFFFLRISSLETTTEPVERIAASPPFSFPFPSFFFPSLPFPLLFPCLLDIRGEKLQQRRQCANRPPFFFSSFFPVSFSPRFRGNMLEER